MSSAHLTGLTALGNGHTIEGKTLIFDANFYLSDGEILTAALRYFNRNDMVFGAKGMYEIRTSIAKMPEGAIQVAGEGSEVLQDSEYDLIGDITWLHEVKAPDPKQRPFLDVIGIATNVVNNEATFDMDSQQYTQFLSKRRDASILPVCALIPDSPRYKVIDGKSNKPVPKQNSPVAASGFLTRVLPRKNNDEEQADRFYMSVESITFLGHSAPDPLPESTTQVHGQKGKRKQLIDFNAPDSAFADGQPPQKKLKNTNPDPGVGNEHGGSARVGTRSMTK